MKYKDYYIHIAAEFDRVRLDRIREINLATSFVRKHLKPSLGLVLDVGCGTGRYADALRRSGYSLVGVDLSIAQLLQTPQTIRIVCGTAVRLPFKEESFAGCLIYLVIHQIDSIEVTSAISESFRVLRPGGYLIIKTCSDNDLRQRPFGDVFPSSYKINRRRYPRVTKLIGHACNLGFSFIEKKRTYSEEIMSPDDLLSSIKAKHNTTLVFLSAEEFDSGVEVLKSKLRGLSTVMIPHRHTFIVFRRPVA